MGVDCCAYGSVGKALGIVRPRNWLPILGTTGRVVVGVKLDGLEGGLSELGRGSRGQRAQVVVYLSGVGTILRFLGAAARRFSEVACWT